MLEEAQHLKQDGSDVVIGALETLERKETAEKAKGLESIPKRAIAIAICPSLPPIAERTRLAYPNSPNCTEPQSRPSQGNGGRAIPASTSVR